MKVKIKATLHRLGGWFKANLHSGKWWGKHTNKYWKLFRKIQDYLDLAGNNYPSHPCGVPSNIFKVTCLVIGLRCYM